MGVISGKRYLKYRCPSTNQQRYIRRQCDMQEITMDKLHEGVRNALIYILNNKRILEDALAMGYRTDLPKLEDKLKQLQGEIKQFKAKRKNLNDMRMSGDVDAKEYKRLAGLIARDESAYLSNMDDVRTQINSSKNIGEIDVDVTKQWMKEISELVKTADIDLMRHILSMLLIKVEVLDRLEDRTPIINVKGIVPYRIENSLDQIRIDTSKPIITTTTAQTSACSYFERVSKPSSKKILSKNGFTYEYALAMNKKTCKIFMAIYFESIRLRTKLKKYFRLKNN